MVALEIPLDGEGTRHKAQLLNVATQAECSIAINMNTVCAAFRLNMCLCQFFFRSFCRIQISVVSVQYITHLHNLQFSQCEGRLSVRISLGGCV